MKRGKVTLPSFDKGMDQIPGIAMSHNPSVLLVAFAPERLNRYRSHR